MASAPPTVSDTANTLTCSCGAAELSTLVVLTGASAMATGTGPSRVAPAISPQATIGNRNILMPAFMLEKTHGCSEGCVKPGMLTAHP